MRPRASQSPQRASFRSITAVGDMDAAERELDEPTALPPPPALPSDAQVVAHVPEPEREPEAEPIDRAEKVSHGSNGHAAHATPSVERADEHEHLASSFFARPHSEGSAEAWEDTPLPMMTLGSRRAMYAALSIFGVSALLLVGYLAYARILMPVPAELGRGHGLPPPVANATTARAPANTLELTAAPVGPAAAVLPAAPSAAPPIVAAGPTATGSATIAAVEKESASAQAAAPAVAVAPAAEPAAAELVAAVAPAPAPRAAPAPTPETAASSVADPATAELLSAANALYDRGQRRAALAAYQQLIARAPNNAEALSKLAFIYLDTRDNEHARSFAARAVEVDPKSSEGWIVLGAANEGLGDRVAARTAYRTCAALGTGPYALECRRLAR